MFDFTPLNRGKMKIVFTKKDGTDRTMICTKNPEMVGEEFKPKGTGIKAKEGLQRVFDLEKQAWRSFLEESVKSVEIL